MAITSKTGLRAAMAKPQAYLMRTHKSDGAEYTTHDGRAVSRKVAIAAGAQLDLFETKWSPDNELIPNGDGLFPGFSQTWRLES